MSLNICAYRAQGSGLLLESIVHHSAMFWVAKLADYESSHHVHSWVHVTKSALSLFDIQFWYWFKFGIYAILCFITLRYPRLNKPVYPTGPPIFRSALSFLWWLPMAALFMSLKTLALCSSEGPVCLPRPLPLPLLAWGGACAAPSQSWWPMSKSLN